MVSGEIAGAAAVGCSRRQPEADERPALVIEVAVHRRAGAREKTDLMKARADDAALLRLRNRVADLMRASGQIDARSGVDPSLAWFICLLCERRQVFDVDRREL